MSHTAPTSRFPRAFLFACLLVFAAGSVHAQDVTKKPDIALAGQDEANVKKGIFDSQAMLTKKREVIIQKYNKKVMETAQDLKNLLILQDRQRNLDDAKPMPWAPRLTGIAVERAKSGILTDQTRHALDEANYQVLNGYTTVSNAGYFGAGDTPEQNPFAKSRLDGIGKIYELHVKLFCNPQGQNAPPGCGADRLRAGITGNENFVDFFLSEKTWPQETVLDVVQIARAYFFDIPERLNINRMNRTKEPALAFQAAIANSSLRMSVLNSLAARRAPTSTATDSVLKVLLQTYAIGNNISTTNYKEICDKPKPANELEVYVCSFTNNPIARDGKPLPADTQRIISQASIDRIMQHDYYLSNAFYSSINTPTMQPRGALDRMEVFMLAQQLSQDYYMYRLLQMRTAVEAVNMNKRSAGY